MVFSLVTFTRYLLSYLLSWNTLYNFRLSDRYSLRENSPLGRAYSEKS